jgi:hypothetical protein
VTSEKRIAGRRFYPDWETVAFGPEWLGVAYGDPDEGLEPLIVDDRDEQNRHWKGVPYRHWPRFEWSEAGIEIWGAAARRSVTIVRDATGEILEDEADGNLLTVYLNPPAGDATGRTLLFPAHPKYVLRGTRHRPRSRARHEEGPGQSWAAIWLWPADANRTENLHFSVALKDGPLFSSAPFTIQDIESGLIPAIVPPDCPPGRGIVGHSGASSAGSFPGAGGSSRA